MMTPPLKNPEMSRRRDRGSLFSSSRCISGSFLTAKANNAREYLTLQHLPDYTLQVYSNHVHARHASYYRDFLRGFSSQNLCLAP